MASKFKTDKEREGFLAFYQGKRNPPGYLAKEEARQWRLGNDRAKAEAETGSVVPNKNLVRESLNIYEKTGILSSREASHQRIREMMVDVGFTAPPVEESAAPAEPLFGGMELFPSEREPSPPVDEGHSDHGVDGLSPVLEAARSIGESIGEVVEEIIAHERTEAHPSSARRGTFEATPKRRGTWWDSKTEEEKADITARRLASRGLSPVPAEAKRKGPKRTHVRNRTAEEWREYHRIRDAKKTAKQYIARLEFHGLEVPAAARQRARDGVTPFKGERINTLVYKRDQEARGLVVTGKGHPNSPEELAREPSPSLGEDLDGFKKALEKSVSAVSGIPEPMLRGESAEVKIKTSVFFDTCVPMRGDWVLPLRLPLDFNMKEAERIARVLVAYAKHPITK